MKAKLFVWGLKAKLLIGEMEAIVFGKGKQKFLLRDLKQSLLFENGSAFLHLGNESKIYVWGMKANVVFRK